MSNPSVVEVDYVAVADTTTAVPSDTFGGEQFLAIAGTVAGVRLIDNVTLARNPGVRVVREAFLVGTEPVQSYTTQAGAVHELPWYQQRRFYGKPKDRERMPEDIEDWEAVIERRKEEEES